VGVVGVAGVAGVVGVVGVADGRGGRGRLGVMIGAGARDLPRPDQSPLDDLISLVFADLTGLPPLLPAKHRGRLHSWGIWW